MDKKEYVSFENGYGITWKFEVVESVPKGFRIWNIGKHMIDGYLPLCELIGNTYNINPDTLKAIKMENAQVILSAVGYGYCEKDGINEMIENLKNRECTSREAELIQQALPYMKDIKWD